MYYPISKPDWDKYKCSVSYTYGWHGTKFHDGVDYCPNNPANAGVPIIAPQDGYCNQWIDGNGALYSWIVNGNVITNTAHYRSFVGGSRQVKAGEVIGIMGTTGNSTGVHVHFGVKINNVWVDPNSQNLIYYGIQPTMATLDYPIPCKTLNTAEANVRKEPTTKSDIVRKMPPLSKFNCTKVTDGETITQNNRTSSLWYWVGDGWFGGCWTEYDYPTADCSIVEAELKETQEELDEVSELNHVYRGKLSEINTISEI